jgi:hypothetical protein
MINTLKEKAEWKVPVHPNFQMRFDCKIEDSFINHTYKKATGMTIHSIIASNLIHCGIKTKSQLKKAVEYYDNIIDERKEEIMSYLGIK